MDIVRGNIVSFLYFHPQSLKLYMDIKKGLLEFSSNSPFFAGYKNEFQRITGNALFFLYRSRLRRHGFTHLLLK